MGLYCIFFVLSGSVMFFYVNLILIGCFACIVGLMCGAAAALSLSMSMQGFHANRGAASAVQAFIRYFFCGVGLLCCNFIQLTYFYQLILIFLGISVIMIAIYSIEFLLNE